MKSVKPGRGPSAMNAIGSLGAVIFGILWTIFAFQISPLFALFGVVFVILGIVQFFYHLHNTKSEDRFSVVDITDNSEESDPLNEKYGRETAAFRETDAEEDNDTEAKSYCPYCGEKLRESYSFCPKCGKKIED